MLARWWTFGIWALVAGSAVFWGLRIFVAAPSAPPDTQVAQPGGDLRGDLTRLFGIDAPAPEPLEAAAPMQAAPDPRFTLVGVVSPRDPRAAREGVALIAIDGNPAKAYRVGMVVDGGTVLQRVSARGAQLGPRGGPSTVALELPPLPAAATGTLPPAGASGMQGFQPGGFRPAMQPSAAYNAQPDYNNVQDPNAQDTSQGVDQVQLR